MDLKGIIAIKHDMMSEKYSYLVDHFKIWQDFFLCIDHVVKKTKHLCADPLFSLKKQVVL